MGDCSLREAVNAANASSDDDVITFAPDLTLITLTGEIQIQNHGSVSLNGSGANVLTIDAGAGHNRIFFTDNATVTIADLTLTGGDVTFINSDGGAIYVNQGSLTLERAHITGNVAFENGGGVYFFGGSGHQIRNSTFSENVAGHWRRPQESGRRVDDRQFHILG